uniref:Uncharacterized protein n=1 Tax=Romanomermis culicivorax TaxID=13658 RepID=A0A915KBR2_ROMCU
MSSPSQQRISENDSEKPPLESDSSKRKRTESSNSAEVVMADIAPRATTFGGRDLTKTKFSPKLVSCVLLNSHRESDKEQEVSSEEAKI